MGVSCPPCTKNFERFLLLVADLVFFAPTFDLWLFFVIFADIVLMLGEKSGKPALLTLWLVIFFINIVGLFLMWVALGISIYLHRRNGRSKSPKMCLRNIWMILSNVPHFTGVNGYCALFSRLLLDGRLEPSEKILYGNCNQF